MDYYRYLDMIWKLSNWYFSKDALPYWCIFVLDCLVREGERDTSFYIIARGIWRGHYLRDGQEVSVWFASEGEALFSTWGYV